VTDLREPEDYSVVLVPFPGSVHACVCVDELGYATIYINVKISPEARLRALDHELYHMKRGHFWNHYTIYEAEAEAYHMRPLGELKQVLCRSFRELTDAERAALAVNIRDGASHLRQLTRQAADSSAPLCQILRELRKEKRLTRAELSSMAGVSQETIKRIEDGAESPSADLLRYLGELYGVVFKGGGAA